MRQIGTIADETDARTFADYLLTLGITTRLDPLPDGWAVWVHKEDLVPQAAPGAGGVPAGTPRRALPGRRPGGARPPPPGGAGRSAPSEEHHRPPRPARPDGRGAGTLDPRPDRRVGRGDPPDAVRQPERAAGPPPDLDPGLDRQERDDAPARCPGVGRARRGLAARHADLPPLRRDPPAVQHVHAERPGQPHRDARRAPGGWPCSCW